MTLDAALDVLKRTASSVKVGVLHSLYHQLDEREDCEVLVKKFKEQGMTAESTYAAGFSDKWGFAQHFLYYWLDEQEDLSSC